MTYLLDWPQLLSTTCFRSRVPATDDNRNAFENDYDRLIYSSAFRRLQDKAQVFPLERSDFVRTRLTHSLEVASRGYSMAIDAYSKDPNRFPGVVDRELAAVVEVACLAHDIGNPPFGHCG